MGCRSTISESQGRQACHYDYQPAGAILRVPQDNDNRGNIHVRSGVDAADQNRGKHLCGCWPKIVSERPLFVGLDFIGERLTEITTSRPVLERCRYRQVTTWEWRMCSG